MLCEATCMLTCCYAAGNGNNKFYYFNPDSSQSNLTRLKQEMERFLDKKYIALSFQPFAKYHDFHREMKENSPAIVLLPEWYLRKNKEKSDLKPFLQPVRKGQVTYHKVLLVTKESKLTLQGLQHKTIAMTTMGSDTPDLLNHLIFNQYKINSDSLNIISTPKDSDALFGLVMGQVDAALVSENNLQKIGGINPRIMEIVTSLAKSRPIALPILCICTENGKVSDENIMKLKKIFLETEQSDDSADLMEMLQIDAWRNYSL